MNIGLYANIKKKLAPQVLQRVRKAFLDAGASVFLEEASADLLCEKGVSMSYLVDHVDIMIVLGGDGTMLGAMAKMGSFSKPIAGINIGTLGFLTTSTDNDVERIVTRLMAGDFHLSQRTILEATVFRATEDPAHFLALNEITLSRGVTGRLILLKTKVNGVFLNNYRADGLIISTPTGSTAYNLSAGGPLVSPKAACFVITPICPHSLSQRSLVIDDESIIEIEVEDRDQESMLFSADGRETITLLSTDRIEVSKASWRFNLVQCEDHSFYASLRTKLGWNDGFQP